MRGAGDMGLRQLHMWNRSGVLLPRIWSPNSVLWIACCFLLPGITAFRWVSLHRPLERNHAQQYASRVPGPPVLLRRRSDRAWLPSRAQRRTMPIYSSVGTFDGLPANSSSTKETDLETNSVGVVVEAMVLDPLSEANTSHSGLSTQPLSAEQEQQLRSLSRRVGKMLPAGDGLDKQILLLTVPAVVNGLLLPIVGLIDTFYVGKLGDPLAFAAQGAGNQVFSSTLGALSFLPTVITPLVAEAHARGQTDKVQRHVGEGMFLSVLVGLAGMALLLPFPQTALGLVLPAGSLAYPVAVQYFLFRVLGFVPSLVSSVGFSSLRGTMDTVRPMQVSLLVNGVRVLLEPVLIFSLAMGVAGAGLSTMLCEFLSAGLFLRLLLRRGLVQWSSMLRVPSLSSLRFLGASGIVLQLRALALNLIFMKGAAAAQHIDLAGTSAAAHVLTTQVFSFGATILFALSTVATVLASTGLARFQEQARGGGGAGAAEAFEAARASADRLLVWGAGIGAVLAVLLLGSMPVLHLLSPLPAVVDAARTPTLIGAGMMLFCGVCFVGEGIMQGQKAFVELTVMTLTAGGAMLWCLESFGGSLAGIWASFVLFNVVRAAMALVHHFWLGPLSARGRRRQLQQPPPAS